MIVILGPTATGKTHFAAYLANIIGAEIISADSRQVYKQMTIGTGKDYDDYMIDGTLIPSHLIDIVEPGYEYNIYEYKRDFMKAYNDIVSRGKKVIMCGGSGLYLESVLSNYRLEEVPFNMNLRAELAGKSYDELEQMLVTLKKKSQKNLHNHTDLDTNERLLRAIEIETFMLEHNECDEDCIIPNIIVGICADRDVVRYRITQRLSYRLEEQNMVEEVQNLIDSGVDSEQLKRYGLEYKFITMYLLGEISYDQMFEKLNIAIHQFSKRQMTWFRRMEKKGFKINWVDAEFSDVEKLDFLRNNGLNI